MALSILRYPDAMPRALAAPLLGALALVGLAACVPDAPPLEAPEAGVTGPADAAAGLDVPALLALRCGTAGCHAAEAPGRPAAGGLDLVSPGLEGRLVGVAAFGCADAVLALPGSPSDSWLVIKLREARPRCGERMPIGPSPLDEAEIAAIEAWIAGLSVPDAGPTEAGVDAGLDAGPDASPEDAAPPDAGCGAGEQLCRGACVDVRESALHCGACDRPCGGGRSCESGTCVCPSGQLDCGGRCVDPDLRLRPVRLPERAAGLRQRVSRPRHRSRPLRRL